ncbi:histidine kinase [Beutenbergia cavernae DSM 12333]|uniref:histidine kinase n=1 Tax=Beutenbergia cavernae (strain ATCC BAA-8 / DSM 12333 / CCUG 43141 / JCM 11478 / NBRC 16432 / NCIMB 13614 / HKI 0122) TaxID=471853 RepID=C5BUZ4_BEUC1|nr:histidine kinase [Beutenbergia cavernae]ACQ78368.1 histidine kinase [Beutenbergia cavernae DSM 12333]
MVPPQAAPPDRTFPARRLTVPTLVLGFFTVAGTWGAHRFQSDERSFGLGTLVLVLAVVACLPLAARRPHIAAPLAVALTLGYLALGFAHGPILFAAGVVIALATATGRPPVAYASAAAYAVGFVVIAALQDGAPTWSAAGAALAFGGLPVLVGLLLRTWRDRAMARRALRAAEERTSLADERLRLARELHDVLAHSLSAIAVQAGVAAHLLDRDPDLARRALLDIRTQSTESLDEVRSLIGILRADGDADAGARAPGADLDAIPTLVERTRAGGIAVDLVLTVPDGVAVADAVSRAAYRVVQEGLTNVRRHSAARAARVRVTGDTAGLTISVHDGGPPAAGESSPGSSAGWGLRGMRERVEQLGGTVEAGPDSDGGFTVRVRLPYAAAREGTS